MHATARPTGGNVLVVEDNDDYWFLIERAMKQTFPDVSIFRGSTPAEALALLNEWSALEWEMPKVVLLDLYLPNRADGWYVLEEIRQLPAPVNQVPVIILSSSDQQTDITESYKRTISAYLIKPFTFDQWVHCFQDLRSYWWETVALPPMRS